MLNDDGVYKIGACLGVDIYLNTDGDLCLVQNDYLQEEAVIVIAKRSVPAFKKGLNLVLKG